MLKNILAILIILIICCGLNAQENKNIKKIIPQSKSTNAEINKNEQTYSATQTESKKDYTISSNDKMNIVTSDSTSKSETKKHQSNTVMTEQQYNDLIIALEIKLEQVKKNKSKYKKAKQNGWIKNTEAEINRLKAEKNSIYSSSKNTNK